VLTPTRGIKGAVSRFPFEDDEVTISRSAGKVTLPCAFMLVAEMNPCPCGYLGDTRHECRCPPTPIQRYRARLSGPLLDRIDLHPDDPAAASDPLYTWHAGNHRALVGRRGHFPAAPIETR